MIKKGISLNKCNKKKQVLYKILKGSHATEFPSSELVEVSNFLSNTFSDSTLVENSAIEDHSDFSRDISIAKKLTLKASISRGHSVNKVLKSFPKHCASMAVIVGTNQEDSHGSSIGRCCASKIPATMAVFVVYKDRIVSTKRSVLQLKSMKFSGFRLNPRPEFYQDEESTSLRDAEEQEFENIEPNKILTSENESRCCSEELNDQNFSLDHEKSSLGSTYLVQKEQPDLVLGWPLLGRTWPLNHKVIKNVGDHSTDGSINSRDETSSSSVSSHVTDFSHSKPGWPLLRISAPVTLHSSKQSEDGSNNSLQMEIICSKTMKLPKESELFSELVSSNYKKVSYAELEKATRQFSSDSLIGEGGCSNVYKGCLSSGKPVAVKVLKSYKEAWNDFILEVDIISSLNHQNITPLIGVCTEDNSLILVYDFLPKGSLEESLHGNNQKFVLPWEVRFKVAVAIAEALNYLHKQCSRPVIHRDVKSSNILLSNDFNPQLSDFGLAIWGPTDSNSLIQDDVVGTFGYIAPEYFMHGRISDKVDVYSFGVVLLELLSGRRPIGPRNLKGQESLVKWAKPILEKGDVEALLDPNLADDFDSAEMQRLALVANLCINQSAQLRPTATQILELLRGEKDAKELVYSQSDETHEDDELLLEFGGKPHLDFSYLVMNDATSMSSADATLLASRRQNPRLKLKDYFKEPLE